MGSGPALSAVGHRSGRRSKGLTRKGTHAVPWHQLCPGYATAHLQHTHAHTHTDTHTHTDLFSCSSWILLFLPLTGSSWADTLLRWACLNSSCVRNYNHIHTNRSTCTLHRYTIIQFVQQVSSFDSRPQIYTTISCLDGIRYPLIGQILNYSPNDYWLVQMYAVHGIYSHYSFLGKL